MCVDQKMIRQQLKNAKKAKYEMGNFCEQFGLPPIAPSRRHRKKPDKFTKKYRHTKRRVVKLERPDKIFRKHKRSKTVKTSKGKCFNCGKKGHYAYKCPNPPNKLKNKINSLNIDEEEKNDLFRILQSQDYSDSDSSYINEVTSDDSCYILPTNHLIEMFSKLAAINPVVKVNFAMLLLTKKNKKIY
jgi:hypothetical protein